jgi:hypothetical protein
VSQENKQLKWIIISMVIISMVQILVSFVYGVFVVATFGIGLVLIFLVKPFAYFVGGMITGIISPGMPILEPALGAALITLLGALWDFRYFSGLKFFFLLVVTAVAFVLSMIGTRVGEKIQHNL